MFSGAGQAQYLLAINIMAVILLIEKQEISLHIYHPIFNSEFIDYNFQPHFGYNV